MPGGHHPRGTVEHRTEVVTLPKLGFVGRDAHPDRQRQRPKEQPPQQRTPPQNLTTDGSPLTKADSSRPAQGTMLVNRDLGGWGRKRRVG